MERHTPNPERLTDEQLIDLHIDSIDPETETISDAAARVISSQIASPNNSFATLSTRGIIDTDRITDDYVYEYRQAQDQDDEAQIRRLKRLAEYIDKRIEEGTAVEPVAEWHKLWLSQPGETQA